MCSDDKAKRIHYVLYHVLLVTLIPTPIAIWQFSREKNNPELAL